LPERRDEEELLDRSGHEPGELARNLRDIRRVNRFFGGTSVVLRHVPELIAGLSAERPLVVLDVGTGSGDIPLALSRWAEATGRAVSIIASDASDEIISLARRHVAGRPDITLARFDARSVPLPDASMDVVLCSLALHHFAPADAVRVLREMDRLARCGFVVNDLRRGRAGFVAAWLAAHLTTANRLTRHDAPLSVLRAYTPAELRDLLARAGVQDAVVAEHAWFRMAAVKAVGRPHD
jgi:SAM-dependent methyltransferase